jgi:hypothetical protein
VARGRRRGAHVPGALPVAPPAALGPHLLLALRLGAGGHGSNPDGLPPAHRRSVRCLDEPGAPAVLRPPGRNGRDDDRRQVSPPITQVLVVGGGAYGPPTTRNPQSVETIDLTQLAPPPAWTRTADMSFARTNVNAVLVPDGTVFVVGGPASVAPGALGCGPPAGLCDCDCKSAGRRVLAPSAAILERVVTFWRGGS